MNYVDKKTSSFVIFSVYQLDHTSIENDLNHYDTLKELRSKGFACKEVQGRYKGDNEKSIYIEFSDPKELDLIKSIAAQFKQESILLVDTNRRAVLNCLESDDFLDLGVFKQVSKYEALRAESSTYDEVNNGYYICEVK